MNSRKNELEIIIPRRVVPPNHGGDKAQRGIFGAKGAFGSIGNKFAQGALRGALSSSITQGVSVATGLQKKISWAGIAGASLSGGIMAELGAGLDTFDVNASFGNVLSHAGVAAAGAIGNAATRTLIDGSSFGDNLIAALPDIIGGTIGNLLTSRLTTIEERKLAAAIGPDMNAEQRAGLRKAARFIDFYSPEHRAPGTTLAMARNDAGTGAQLLTYAAAFHMPGDTSSDVQAAAAMCAGLDLAGVRRASDDQAVGTQFTPEQLQEAERTWQNFRDRVIATRAAHRFAKRPELVDGSVTMNSIPPGVLAAAQRQLDANPNSVADVRGSSVGSSSLTAVTGVTDVLGAFVFESREQAVAAMSELVMRHLRQSGVPQSQWTEWGARSSMPIPRGAKPASASVAS